MHGGILTDEVQDLNGEHAPDYALLASRLG